MRVTIIWFALIFSGVAGCSNTGSTVPPETTVVSGKAIQPSGQPITGGRIRFSPVYGAEGAEAYADIKSDGTFTLQSFGGRDGAMPGTYKVTLSGKALMGVAPKYQDPESSTMKIEITKDKKDLGLLKFQ